MKMTKRILTLVLAVAMVISLIPAVSAAAGDTITWTNNWRDKGGDVLGASPYTLTSMWWPSAAYSNETSTSYVDVAASTGVSGARSTTTGSYRYARFNSYNKDTATNTWPNCDDALVLKTKVPAGTYQISHEFYKCNVNGDIAVYINGQYAGTYYGYDESVTAFADTANLKTITLNTLSLTPDANGFVDIAFRPIKRYHSEETTVYYMPRAVTFTEVTAPVSINSVECTVPETLEEGTTTESLTAKVKMSDDSYRSFFEYDNAGAQDTANTVTVTSDNTDVISVNDAATKETDTTFTLTANGGGTANVTIAAKVDGVTQKSVVKTITVPSGDPKIDVTENVAKVALSTANASAGGTAVNANITTNLTSYTQGQGQNNNIGTLVTATAPTEVAGLKFRYWLNVGANRVASTNSTVSFSLGTNTRLLAVYSNEEDGTLVEFFNANGDVLSSGYYAVGAEITYPSLPSLTGYGTATSWSSNITTAPENVVAIVAQYVEPTSEFAVTVNGGTPTNYKYDALVELTAPVAPEGQVFSHWTKNGKTVSYSSDYSFHVWDAATVDAVYADTAAAEAPGAIIDTAVKADNAYMAEFVGLSDYTVIEKGIIFKAGTPTINDYDEKAISTKDNTQFTAKASSASFTARAYAIITDGTKVYVVYSE